MQELKDLTCIQKYPVWTSAGTSIILTEVFVASPVPPDKNRDSTAKMATITLSQACSGSSHLNRLTIRHYIIP